MLASLDESIENLHVSVTISTFGSDSRNLIESELLMLIRSELLHLVNGTFKLHFREHTRQNQGSGSVFRFS